MSHYAFVVDTRQYAGNFDKMLGTYLTGFRGEDFYLHDMANKVSKSIVNVDFIKNSIVEKIDKENSVGNSNPPEQAFMIFSGNGWCSVGIFFEIKPTHEVIEELKERAIYFSKNLEAIYNEYGQYYNPSSFTKHVTEKDSIEGVLEITGFRMFKISKKKKFDPSDSESMVKIDI